LSIDLKSQHIGLLCIESRPSSKKISIELPPPLIHPSSQFSNRSTLLSASMTALALRPKSPISNRLTSPKNGYLLGHRSRGKRKLESAVPATRFIIRVNSQLSNLKSFCCLSINHCQINYRKCSEMRSANSRKPNPPVSRY
jgi:hypothetical protein